MSMTLLLNSRLTEDDIDKFVDYMLPSPEQAIYAKAHFVTVPVAIAEFSTIETRESTT